MILVRIELLPGGAPTHRLTLATIEISNVSDLAPVSDYRIETFEERNPLLRRGERGPRRPCSGMIAARASCG